MVTFEEVCAAVGPVEPNYEQAAELGADALPHLDRLIFAEQDVGLATKATSLVGYIRDPRSAELLQRAATHPWPTVRAAAAAVAHRLGAEEQPAILLPLLQDEEPSIRKVALRSASATPSTELLDAITYIAEQDPLPQLRQQADELRNATRRSSYKNE